LNTATNWVQSWIYFITKFFCWLHKTPTWIWPNHASHSQYPKSSTKSTMWMVFQTSITQKLLKN